MYKLWLLVACFACAVDGRRLKATLDQDFGSQDVRRQRPMEQLSSKAGSKSHGQGNSQFAKNLGLPRKLVPILLALFSPASSANGLASNRSIYDTTQTPNSSNPIGAHAGTSKVMVDQDDVEEALPENWEPTVRVVVVVDWEGFELLTEDLRFFEYFRKAHPEVPLTHFLSPAYFTKREEQSIGEVSPHEVVSPIDEHGLHLHGWKSLVESSGVQYRSEPNIWQSPEELEKDLEEEKEAKERLKIYVSEGGDQSSEPHWNELEMLLWKEYLNRDVGYDTDIRAYSVDDLRAIISHSKEILEKNGLKVGKSFRVGSRLAGQNVLEAFHREGFRVNSSAFNLDQQLERLSPAEREPWKDVPFLAWVRELWPDITKESQPFPIETPVGWVLEMPDTGGPADHSTVKEMVDHIDSSVQQLGSVDRFVQIGFMQESAVEYGPRVLEAITEIKRKHGHRVVFETLEASARRARSMLRLKELESNSKPHVTQNS